MAQTQKLILPLLTVGFIATFIAGTYLHEVGHYTAARLMGFQAHIYFGFTRIFFVEKPISPTQRFWFTLAGPLQTMLTGTAGLLTLAWQKQKAVLSITHWCLVFLILFWLRQPLNLLLWLAGYSVSGLAPASGDEMKLSRLFHLPVWTLINITGFIGLLVFLWVLFRVVPRSVRPTFLLAGCLSIVFIIPLLVSLHIPVQ
jgi:hypothetical protein